MRSLVELVVGRDDAVQCGLDALGRRLRGVGEVGDGLGSRLGEVVDGGAELVDPLGVADPRVEDGLALKHRVVDQLLQLSNS